MHIPARISPATKVPASIAVVVVEVARDKFAVVSFETVQLGALGNAVVNVTVQDVPAVAPTVTLKELSLPTIVAVVVPHEFDVVFVTAGTEPLDMYRFARKLELLTLAISTPLTSK